jgi:hypothetical protein
MSTSNTNSSSSNSSNSINSSDHQSQVNTNSHSYSQSVVPALSEQQQQQHYPQHARSIRSEKTVTPDAAAPMTEESMSLEGHVLGSSPRTSLRRERESSRSLLLSRSESTEKSRSRLHYTSSVSASVASRRARTRTLDEGASRDVSPGNTAPQPGSRLRHGSVRVGSNNINNNETSSFDPSHSASTTPSLSNLSHSTSTSTSTSTPKRPRSPVSVSDSASVSGALPNSGARRILHLMKTLCGRMSGTLWFRRGPAATWLQSYCYIQEDTGSLLCEAEAHSPQQRTLIPDLRGCQVRTAMDEDSQMPYLDISVPNSTLQLHIRLKDRKDFDSWFAALLCWQPIRPRGIHNKMTKPQSPTVQAGGTLTDSRRNSEMSLTLREAPIIKVGPMVYWDSNISYTNAATPRSVKPASSRFQSYGSHWWRRVSCTLRENGELKLYAEAGSTLLSVVQLSQLSRSAVQRLDPSVLDNDFCIAIYPQYTSGATVTTAIRPIYLSLESRILYEVWFVLLRAFTIPQLYGPKPYRHSDEPTDIPSSTAFDHMIIHDKIEMFRMERSLSIRIIEAKLPHAPLSSLAEFNQQHANRNNTTNTANKPELMDGYYVEIHLDGETRGKTQIKHESMAPFWREEFDYLDLPAVLTSASVLLKRRPPDLSSPREQHEMRLVHEAYGLLDPTNTTGSSAGFMPVQNDQTVGKVEIFLDELEASKEVEKWWHVMNQHGENVGEILIKARAEENVILMSKDYKPLNDLLHNFSNELTLQVAQMIPTELRRLSDLLLNIFQVSDQVTEWIMALVEEEIDGVHKETPVSRLRYNRRVANNHNETDSNVTAASERELIVRDMNKNATLEANLLFRGNTLLTKSLDSHMRRVGKEYLLDCLGPIIRDINEKDPDCEVDPNRVTNQHDLKKNWDRLINCTKSVWNTIKVSASGAPSELRVIFRHIRACAEDRYGDFLRSVSYSSVSGFLFLRFFCPAVLNPKLFGLLKDDPKPRARRTFTLIAKSLQGLANMASFGSKEHWMEPMNVFLTDHREAFKTFINDICSISAPDGMVGQKPASYSTPLAIQSRLPMTSREGFPSLPYLIDQSREIASLVELWLHGTTNGSEAENLAAQIGKEDGDLLIFHKICKSLDGQTKECLSRAERAERPNSALSFRWEELIDQLQTTSLLENGGRADDALEGPSRDSLEDVTGQAAQLDSARGRGFNVSGTGLGLYHADTEGHPPPSWEEDRDGGAQTAAVSILSQDSTRPFDKGSLDVSRPEASTTTTTASISASGSYSNNISAAFMREGSTPLQRDMTSASLNSHSPQQPREREQRRSGDRHRDGSFSGTLLGTETDVTTALPSLARERERREREKEKKEKAKREERERRLKDFVPGLNNLRRKKEQKEKDKEKD